MLMGSLRSSSSPTSLQIRCAACLGYGIGDLEQAAGPGAAVTLQSESLSVVLTPCNIHRLPDQDLHALLHCL